MENILNVEDDRVNARWSQKNKRMQYCFFCVNVYNTVIITTLFALTISGAVYAKPYLQDAFDFVSQLPYLNTFIQQIQSLFSKIDIQTLSNDLFDFHNIKGNLTYIISKVKEYDQLIKQINETILYKTQ